MKILGALALGYLVSSFTVAIYFSAVAWGSQGTTLVLIFMPLFLFMPFWLATNLSWTSYAGFIGFLLVTSVFFRAILVNERTFRPGRRIAISGFAFIAIQCVAAPMLVDTLGARSGSDASFGRVMIAALVLQLVLSVALSMWHRHLEQVESRGGT